MDIILKMVGEYGLSVGILAILLIVVRHILNQQNRIMERADEQVKNIQKQAESERELWINTYDKVADKLEINTKSLDNLRDTTVAGFRYQKKEHENMIECLEGIHQTLMKMNGFSSKKKTRKR